MSDVLERIGLWWLTPTGFAWWFVGLAWLAAVGLIMREACR